jgi:hypothetical protein
MSLRRFVPVTSICQLRGEPCSSRRVVDIGASEIDRKTGRLVQNATNDLCKQFALPLGKPNMALALGQGARRP